MLSEQNALIYFVSLYCLNYSWWKFLVIIIDLEILYDSLLHFTLIADSHLAERIIVHIYLFINFDVRYCIILVIIILL